MGENHRRARLAYEARRRKLMAEEEAYRIAAVGPWPVLHRVNPRIRKPRERYVAVDRGYILVKETPR